MELIVDVDIWMTDTGDMPTTCCPTACRSRRYELVASAAYNHIVLQGAGGRAWGEGARPHVLYGGLARKRVGLGEYFDKTAEEWISSAHPVSGR